VANHPTTTNPNVPSTSTLLADDYGFHYGFTWYRGHFTASGSETGMTLEARQSYSVYLNGTYLGSADESLGVPPHAYASARTFAFPAGLLRPGQDNVIAVLTESLGHDEGWLAGPLAQSPQGIISAQLAGAAESVVWRIQGDAGGEHPADSVRGIFNASGLFGERNGWYLPGFNDTGWQTVALPDNWSARQAGGVAVGWYRTHFTLNLPANTQIPLGLTLPHVSDKAVIWLNGWLLGRYWEQEGPQHTFYLPEGILNPNGDNVLSIAAWNRGGVGGLTAEPLLQPYVALASHSLKPTGDPSDSKQDYWHTRGNLIVDSAGRPVRIAAINWSGMQNVHYVPEGLDRQPLDSIVAHIRAMGFNTIRLPFSNQMVERNPVIEDDVGANPDLKGLHALKIMDRIVQSARKYGLRIILDDHRSTVGSDPEANGLWYTKHYPELAWIHDWQLLARRYRGNDTVVGVDLRDEPHTGPPGPWSINTYLHQGVTWGPYRGVENRTTDWRLAAERGGDAVLRVNSHLLIFVEGVQQYPDPTQPGGLDSYWWGGILGPALKYPVRLSVPRQLVYSPHEYGPVKYNMAFFGPKMTYGSMVAIWEKHWAFLLGPKSPVQAPIFIGEFGTCGRTTKCVEDTKPGSQGLWFSYFTRFLQENPEIGWSFWALNGSSPGGLPEPNYILRLDWHTVRLHQLLDALRDIEVAPPPAS
jgi:aryl-phospho-beta-D-glucosidase BglC (GH1 family)